jgi:D-2-hydroxyacid dehydrogenase (NADP+)
LKFVAWMAYHLESRAIVDDYISRVKQHLAGHELVICEDVESIKREIVDADVFIGWRITPEVFAYARRLRWLQFGSAGIDHTIFPELLASDAVLTTLGGIHTVVVAEHVLAVMLALTRRLDLAMRLQLERRYDRADISSTAGELAGKTVGIVGLGRIGRNIARLAKAFEMRVVGTRRRAAEPMPDVDEVYPASDFRKILPVSDFLVLVLPLTRQTRALLGKKEFELIKAGACLINVARGAMVDHDALAKALKSGRLRGAALDVFPEEPLPPDSPIWDLPNLIITPHTAASSPGYSERGAQVFVRNLDAFIHGGEMVNVYDRQREY